MAKIPVLNPITGQTIIIDTDRPLGR